MVPLSIFSFKTDGFLHQRHVATLIYIFFNFYLILFILLATPKASFGGIGLGVANQKKKKEKIRFLSLGVAEPPPFWPKGHGVVQRPPKLALGVAKPTLYIYIF
jgi:hypothetical protein